MVYNGYFFRWCPRFPKWDIYQPLEKPLKIRWFSHHDVKFTRGHVTCWKWSVLESILHNCSDMMFRDFPANMDWDLNTSAPTVKGSNIYWWRWFPIGMQPNWNPDFDQETWRKIRGSWERLWTTNNMERRGVSFSTPLKPAGKEQHRKMAANSQKELTWPWQYQHTTLISETKMLSALNFLLQPYPIISPYWNGVCLNRTGPDKTPHSIHWFINFRHCRGSQAEIAALKLTTSTWRIAALLLEKKHVYTCIYIYTMMGFEMGPNYIQLLYLKWCEWILL